MEKWLKQQQQREMVTNRGKVQTDESHTANKAIGDAQRTTWREEGEI